VSAARHKRIATSNEAFYRSIGGNACAHTDWAMTVLFYVALHEIQCFLHTRTTTLTQNQLPVPASHRDRKDVLRRITPWQTVAAMYDQFYGWSKRTRYAGWQPSAFELNVAEANLSLLRGELASL
jgi:hypothetical protein